VVITDETTLAQSQVGPFLVGSIRGSRQKAESASEIAKPDTTNGPVSAPSTA
jgi:hypothetical protein